MKVSLNFLASSREKLLTKKDILSYLGIGILFILIFQFSIKLTVLLAIGAVILFFTAKLNWGVYLLAATSFLIGWTIDFSRYEWAREVVYLRAVNAPVVDFVALLLMASIGAGLFFRLWPERTKHLFRYALPGIHWYGLFILVGIISLLSAYEFYYLDSFKFLLRSIIFVYIAFVTIPQIIIQDKRTLLIIFEIWFAAGVMIALFGFSSLFFASQEAWYRIAPYAVKGFAPLGYNHNVLAESLVAIIPLGIYFFTVSKSRDKSLWYAIGAGLMILAMLLTLSRAAWLAFATQVIVLLLCSRRQFISDIKRYQIHWIALALLIPVILYMISFLGTPTVISSNITRMEATKVALFYSSRAPLIGYGPGMFIPILADTTIFTLDFGDPQDSHGFVQKILLEEGIIGLFFFIGFLFWVLRVLWKTHQETRDSTSLFVYLFAMVLGAMVFQLFNTSYFNSHLWLPIGLSLVAARLYSDKLFYEPKK
ncbi:MAG: O-antigen ligase family protein [Candidatus Peribacteraceae bacterium]